jgi:succinylglutamate desuccinylase
MAKTLTKTSVHPDLHTALRSPGHGRLAKRIEKSIAPFNTTTRKWIVAGAFIHTN